MKQQEPRKKDTDVTCKHTPFHLLCCIWFDTSMNYVKRNLSFASHPSTVPRLESKHLISLSLSSRRLGFGVPGAKTVHGFRRCRLLMVWSCLRIKPQHTFWCSKSSYLCDSATRRVLRGRVLNHNPKTPTSHTCVSCLFLTTTHIRKPFHRRTR